MSTIPLGIDVDSSTVISAEEAFDKLSGRLRDTQGRLVAVGSAADTADRGMRGASAATERMQAQLASLQRTANAIAGVFGTMIGADLIGRLGATADAYTAITNSLRVVSGEQANVNALFDELLGIANDTRTPLEAVATLYQRASMAAGELGASQSDLLQFTENVGRALALQGSGAAAASGALLQLSQALGGGIVRAEEFNSILEGAFPIAQAAARGIEEAGGSVAKLRNLVIAGKVSSDEFFGALLDQTEELEAAFAKMAPTLGQAFTVLQNSALAAVGSLNDTVGVTSSLASGLIVVAENMDRVIVYAGTAAAIFGGKLAAGIALSAASTLTFSTALVALRGALIRTGIGALVIGAGELVYRFLQLVKATGGWGEALSLLGEVASGVWEGIKTSATAIGPALGSVWAGVRVKFLSMIADITNRWALFLEAIGASADSAYAAFDSVYAAMQAAQVEQAALAEQAGAAMSAGFAKVSEAVGKLRASVAESEASLGGAATAGGRLGDALSGAAGGAKKAADELARAKDVLGEQLAEHERIKAALAGTSTETEFVAKETERLRDALQKSGVTLDDFLRTAGLTSDEYSAMLRKTEAMNEQWDRQKASVQDIAKALSGIALGSVGAGEGIGDALSAITDGAFGASLDAAFKDAAKTLSDAISKAMSGIGSATGLSDTAMAYAGTGLGMAAVGAINGNVEQIGSGIGSAVGGALGSSLTSGLGGALGALGGPVGMILGGALGGFVSRLFGSDSTWETVNGTAFAGTSYAQDASVRVNFDNPNPTADARLAYAGTVSLLRDFQRELEDFVAAAGGTLRTGAEHVVKETQAVKAITGVLDAGDVPGSGPEAEQLAATISARVAEIMGIAATIVSEAGPPLTQAQVLWRETQAKFSEENVAILRDLGFSAREIANAQAEVRRSLATDFNKEMLDALVDSGRATRAELNRWLGSELDGLKERRTQALRTAEEIGASERLVRASFAAQAKDVRAEFREMLRDMADDVEETRARIDRLQYRGGILNELVQDGASNETMRRWLTTNRAILEEQRRDAIAEARRLGVDVSLVRQLYNQRLVDLERQYGEMRASAAQAAVDRMTEKVNAVDSRRSEILQELAQRAEEARRAEQTLADARANLATSDLAPGGPLDRLAELQRQFADAAAAARLGDADAASRAGSLAQSLLQQGQQVYASSGSYADLFRSVNEQLLAAQNQSGARALRIEGALDSTTFVEATERSTAALLRALGRLDERLADLGDRIDRQTRKIEGTAQTRRVAA